MNTLPILRNCCYIIRPLSNTRAETELKYGDGLKVISEFPNFKKLFIDDKPLLEQYVLPFNPYSDFSFTNLWIWDTDNSTELSAIGDNLIVRFLDSSQADYIYSFMGREEIEKTIGLLLDFAEDSATSPILRLVPDSFNLNSRMMSIFRFAEDRDNFDYVFSVKDLSQFLGSKFQRKRNLVKSFKKRYISIIMELDLKEHSMQSQLISLFELWITQKKMTCLEVNDELEAIKKLLRSLDYLKARALGVFINNRLAGFVIFEILHKNYAIAYFEKADSSYAGIWQYLKNELAIYLAQRGCHYINYESDLGKEGLRTSKLSYHPLFFLKKYTISRLKANGKQI